MGCPVCRATTGILVEFPSGERSHFCPKTGQEVYWSGAVFTASRTLLDKVLRRGR